MKDYTKEVGVAQLRNSSTAITATGQDTELTGVKLKDFGAGILVLLVQALVGTGTYQFDLMGRESASDTAVSIAQLKPTANGVFLAPVDQFNSRLQLTHTIGGTSPSVVAQAVAIAMEKTYLPDDGAIVTS